MSSAEINISLQEKSDSFNIKVVINDPEATGHVVRQLAAEAAGMLMETIQAAKP